MDLSAKLSLLGPVAVLLLTSCAGPTGEIDSARPSLVGLTSSQRGDVLRILQDTARGVDAGEHIAVLPDSATGVRWSDVHQAVIDGGKVVAVAVQSTLVGNETDWAFALLTMEGWPGVLRARHTADGIEISARIGPYPGSQSSQDRSKRLVEATHASLRTLGAVPKIEPYSLGLSAQDGTAR